jgi:hypothetical protein
MTTPGGGTERPFMSVVITVVDGGDVLRRFLDAMLGQIDAPTMELLLPFDATAPAIGRLQADYPRVRFIDIGAVPTVRPVSTAAGQHELYDRRRAAGLHQARGTLIAILEDRARKVGADDVTHALPHGAINGAIDAPGGLLNWAFWACDFGSTAWLRAGERKIPCQRLQAALPDVTATSGMSASTSQGALDADERGNAVLTSEAVVDSGRRIDR